MSPAEQDHPTAVGLRGLGVGPVLCQPGARTILQARVRTVEVHHWQGRNGNSKVPCQNLIVNRSCFENPLSILAVLIASLTAKNTEAPKNNGGSPTPLEENTALGLGAPLKSATFISVGMSPKLGILYAPGPFKKN